jgi:uncharacterized protein
MQRAEDDRMHAAMSTTHRLATPTFELPTEAIAEVCRRFDVRELAVFGSVLREDFQPGSDVDFLVVFESPDLGPWMEKLGRFEENLSDALGRQADVVLKSCVQSAWNYIRREEILRTARTIYAA